MNKKEPIKAAVEHNKTWNREMRRKLQKKLPKHLREIANDITKWNNMYEGKDDKKLEELILDRIRPLSFEDLMVLTSYLENVIPQQNLNT